MSTDKPEFDVGRLLGRGNPHLSPAECGAYQTPRFRTGCPGCAARFRRWCRSLPTTMAQPFHGRRAFWRERWAGQTLMAVGTQDPVLGLLVMTALQTTS